MGKCPLWAPNLQPHRDHRRGPCPVYADRLARFIVSVADYLFERRRCDGKPIDRQATLGGLLAAVRVR
jgi:hypothetical protein